MFSLATGCQYWRDTLVAAGQPTNNNKGDTIDDILMYPDGDPPLSPNPERLPVPICDRERFYDEQFPDDIPDEWSRADQEKSHGIGRRGIPPLVQVRMEIPILEEPLEKDEWDSLMTPRMERPVATVSRDRVPVPTLGPKTRRRQTTPKGPG